MPLGLSVREVPQSVSVITQQRLQDQQLSTLVEVAENVTGVSVNRYETNRGGIYSRGFVVDNYIIDGIPTTYSLPWSSGEIFSSMALYDHIDVVRGQQVLHLVLEIHLLRLIWFVSVLRVQSQLLT